jgi:hypothetical protein
MARVAHNHQRVSDGNPVANTSLCARIVLDCWAVFCGLKPRMSSYELSLGRNEIPKYAGDRFIVKLIGLVDADVRVVIVNLEIAI